MIYEYDNSVRLEDDLYNYVNGKWISKAKIPSDKPSTGGFIDLRDGVEKVLLKDFKKFSKKASKDELLNRAILLYKKAMDEEDRIKGKSYLVNKINYLDNITDANSFKQSIYYLYDNNYPLPFNMGVSEDMKDATKHALCIMGTSTILPDTSMYKSPNKDALLNVYQNMAIKILDNLGINDAQNLVEKALAFDAKLSKIVKSSEEWADYIKNYNPYSPEEVAKSLGFDFLSLICSRYGKMPQNVIVFEPRFLKHYKKLMSDYELYSAWAKVQVALNGASYLSEELRELAGTFSRTISGTKTMVSKEKYAYRLADNYYDEVIGVYYGKKYFGEEAKADVINIVKNLITSYKRRLSENTWLSTATINKAIVKLDTMGIKIGYPDQINKKYYSFVYDVNAPLIEIIDTLKKINSSYSDSLLYKAVDKSSWVMSGNTVNACYNPSFNDITFPAAILQAPFYSIKQSIEENYGGIGCVIGHEISHAFDNNGAQMDELGNINNWWTEEDYNHFKAKTELMIAQFDGLPLAGSKVNGKLSVSENIADNGGIASSLESLKRVKPDAELKLFFFNYARIWCQKARLEYTKLLLTIDVHGPNYYRANMQVRNFPEFYSTFNITPNDKMYLPEDKRLIIW